MASMPKAVVCYICGRQYGTTSIAIHQKTCLKQFEATEAEKPAHLRRALPDPSAFAASFGGSLAAQNEAAAQVSSSSSSSSYASLSLYLYLPLTANLAALGECVRVVVVQSACCRPCPKICPSSRQ